MNNVAKFFYSVGGVAVVTLGSWLLNFGLIHGLIAGVILCIGAHIFLKLKG
jgi:hypothetical protein